MATDERRWLDEREQQAWRGLLRMRSELLLALGQALLRDSDLSSADYEILAILSESDRGALRARDLRATAGWEKSRLAHQVRRMEERGLVVRTVCEEDSRAPLVMITDAGLASVRAAAPAHAARVRELFVDRLSVEQLEQLIEISAAVALPSAAEPGDA